MLKPGKNCGSAFQRAYLFPTQKRCGSIVFISADSTCHVEIKSLMNERTEKIQK
jgi:hypothetical protein